MYRPAFSVGPIVPYKTPDGRTFGSVSAGSGSFQSYLSNSLSKLSSPTQISSSSPLVRFTAPAPASGITFSFSTGETSSASRYSTSSSSSVSGVSSRYSYSQTEARDYEAVKVAQTNRAPMAMFANGDELVMSIISRNGISKTPVLTYSEENGLQTRSYLGEHAESGNYGFTAGGTLHMVAEAWDGMVDWTATSPEGPWTKTDYRDLAPYSYDNLKWGFGYQCPVTGEQFLGFGNNEHSGCVLEYKNGDWQLMASAKDMLFPTSMGVVTKGGNKGTKVIATSTYDKSRLYAATPDGKTEKIGSFDGWGYMTVDHNAGLVYFASETGHVYYSSFNDLDNWQECQYQDAQGNSLSNIGRCGELNVHPQTGQVIVPAAEQGGRIGNNKATTEAATVFYQALPQNGKVVLKEAGRVEGAGLWELRTAVVGDELYYGTGMASSKKQDASPGAIYRIDPA